MPAKTEKEPEIQIVKSEEEPKEVLIEQEKIIEKEEPAEDLKQVDEIKKLHKRLEYSNRQTEKALKKMEEMAQRIQSIQPPTQNTAEGQDELDKLAEKDWKAAVRALGRDEALKTFQELQNGMAQQQARNESLSENEKSKDAVRKKYPMIDDENSREAQVYIEVLNENPQLLKNVYGPELAMYKMEEKLRSSRNPELQRESRVRAAYIPTGRTPNPGGPIILTEEEKELCDRTGTPYDRYASMRKMGAQDFREGVVAE